MGLEKDRLIKRRDGKQYSDLVKAGEVIRAGEIYCIDANGFAVAGVEGDITHLVRGVAEELADNSNGSDGDVSVKGLTGVFNFVNHGTDTVTREHINLRGWIVDGKTIACDSVTERPFAGTIRDLDGDGVWVEVGAADGYANYAFRV